MATRNLKSIDPAQLLPTPEVPESYGPRNDEDLHVHQLVQEALDAGPGKKYATVADFIQALDTRVP
jgi:hypothetical protein